MYRRNWFYWGLTGLALTIVLTVAPWAKNMQNAEKNSPNLWRLGEPIQYENLSVFPVLSGKPVDTSSFVTLDDALSTGQVVITEKGGDVVRRSRGAHPVDVPQQYGASVNQLVLINRSSKPLLLLAGELVSGGKQDRIISKDRIVPPDADPLPLDVFCVEEGRWSAGAQFSAGELMVHPSVREKAAVDQEQAKVWAAVRSGTTSGAGAANGTPSSAALAQPAQQRQTVTVTSEALSSVMTSEARTHSYERIYKSKAIGDPVDAFANQVQERFARVTANLKGEAAVGVVVAFGDDVAWSDIFASPALFARYWPKLLRSYVVEALARPKTGEQASVNDAREFLRPLMGHESIETEPATYRLKQVTEGKYVEIELEALRPADITLHLLKVHRTS
jgi:hypothetical protein